MLSSPFITLLGYLCSGLLLTTLAAPNPFIGTDLVKRAGKHAADHGPQPGVAILLETRSTLAFNAEFDEITQVPGIKFSAAQFSNLKAWQQKESFWIPKRMDTAVLPTKYFFDACLDTPAGQAFKDVQDGKSLTDSQVNLVVKWGTFANQYKSFEPWNWGRDGIMAVSCSIFSVLVADIPNDQAKMMDTSKFHLIAESSTEMIQNLRKSGWTVSQIGKPSETRADLEQQIQGRKGQSSKRQSTKPKHG